MSALMLVLPQVWATATTTTHADAGVRRKGPHRLALVAAAATRSRHELKSAPIVGAEWGVGPEPAPLQDETATAAQKAANGTAFYRKYTEGLLRRYMTMSMEAGRVPSLLGREMFRGKVTHYTVTSFEDVVIFVYDVEKCLAMLGKGQQYLVRKIALQEYSQVEVSAMTGIQLRRVIRHYNTALDRLTRLFMSRGMLQPVLEGGEL